MKLYIYIYIYIYIYLYKIKRYYKTLYKNHSSKNGDWSRTFLSSITRAPLDIDQVNLFEKVSSEIDLYN